MHRWRGHVEVLKNVQETFFMVISTQFFTECSVLLQKNLDGSSLFKCTQTIKYNLPTFPPSPQDWNLKNTFNLTDFYVQANDWKLEYVNWSEDLEDVYS